MKKNITDHLKLTQSKQYRKILFETISQKLETDSSAQTMFLLEARLRFLNFQMCQFNMRSNQSLIDSFVVDKPQLKELWINRQVNQNIIGCTCVDSLQKLSQNFIFMDEETKLKRKQQMELIKQKYRNKNINQTVTREKSPPPIVEIQQEIGKQKKSQIEKKESKNNGDNVLKNIFEAKRREKKRDELEQDDEFYLKDCLKKDPFGLWSCSNSVKVWQDEELSEIQQKPENGQAGKVKKEQKKMLQRQLTADCLLLWISNSKDFLQSFLYTDTGLLKSQQSLPSLKSTNPHFPKILEAMITDFILLTDHPLSEPQKQTLYRCLLEYFTPSPKVLSDILVVCLVRLGNKYISIYSEQLLENIEYYAQKILLFRHILHKQELNNLTNYLINELNQGNIGEVNEKYLWILCLNPTSPQLHQVFLEKNAEDLRIWLVTSTLIKPQQNGTSLSLLYLKCINELITLFKEHRILEKVINLFNELKIPEPLYQPAKALKLKLITAGDQHKKTQQNEQNHGFMGYFNKVVSKIEKNVNIKPQKFQNPPERIIYDEKSKKYILQN